MIEIADAAWTGFATLFSAQVFLYLMLGIVVGMFLGIVPGLSGLTGMGLLLPFAIGQPPEIAFAFLLGMYAVTTQTDTIPAVLIGVPGTAAAQATYLDGYPMAQRGEAGRALSASYFASIWGTLIAAGMFILLLPFLRGATKFFAAPEYFALAVVGLIIAGSLAGDSILKGLIAAGLGLAMSMVGFAPSTGAIRASFGWSYLWDGLPLVPVALGLFAIPEVIDLLTRRRSISDRAEVRGGLSAGFFDTIRHFWLMARCSVIGCVCGVIPGLGGSVAEWFSYGHAVQSSRKKNPQFGKGDIRGVIAPEASTAAQKPGALVPTIALGIPGNAAMALLLGAFLMTGLRPGPEMLTTKLALTFQMTWTIVVANLIAAVLCLVLQRYLVLLCYIRATIIAPMILCFMAIGAMLATYDIGDLVIFGIFGAVGYVFKHNNIPRVPLLIGLVLGGLAEGYLFITLNRYGPSFLWERPIVLAIGLIIIGTIGWKVWSRIRAQALRARIVDVPGRGGKS